MNKGEEGFSWRCGYCEAGGGIYEEGGAYTHAEMHVTGAHQIAEPKEGTDFKVEPGGAYIDFTAPEKQ